MTTLYADRHATPKPRDTPANWRVDWGLFTALRAARTPVHLYAPTVDHVRFPGRDTPPSTSPSGSPTASTTSDLQATRH